VITDKAPVRASEIPVRSRRWVWTAAVAAAFAVGLAIRIASVLGRPHLAAGGDPLEYVGQANLLVEGKGWVDPITFANTGVLAQTAKLPPLFTLLMAVCSVAGFKSFFAHRVWSAILGSTAVPVAALLGREVRGKKVGLLAALVVAVYPNMWLSDGLAMSETISPILAMLVVWAAYLMWKDPRPRRAAVVGVAIGFAGLARDELLLLAVLILLPLALVARDQSRRQKGRLLLVGVGCTLTVVAPWVGFNLSRFSEPVFISDRFGLTVAAANCHATWQGPLRGYWSMACAAQAAQGVHGDESAEDPVALRKGVHYVDRHLSGLPSVEVARLGRTFGFYRPIQQINIEAFVEGRPRLWAFVGLGMFYALAAGAVVGGVLLRRRDVPVFPMIAVAADVVVAVLLTYGQTRFRATLEPFLVILTAVALVSVVWREPSSTPVPSGPT
jgi:4-amino-4-deoxy-L-arabinose transferase-like glycosyltransferase